MQMPHSSQGIDPKEPIQVEMEYEFSFSLQSLHSLSLSQEIIRTTKKIREGQEKKTGEDREKRGESS